MDPGLKKKKKKLQKTLVDKLGKFDTGGKAVVRKLLSILLGPLMA